MRNGAFIELTHDTPPVLWVGIPAHDMGCPHQASILLQGAGQRILLGIRLEFLDEERRGDPAAVSTTPQSARLHLTSRKSEAD